MRAARVLLSFAEREEILMRNVSSFFPPWCATQVVFLNFFEFASLSALLAGNDLAHKHYDAIHIESGLPRSFVFRAFPRGFGQLHKKKNI